MDRQKLHYSECQQPLRFSREEIDKFFSQGLFKDLIAHIRFQRLKGVRFLGAIDFVVTANGKPLHTRQTRFDHSLGVGLLAQWFADESGFADSERNLLVSAALLHDIGHGPLSHSLEPVFKEQFSIDHHRATEDVVANGSERNGVADVLRSYKVDPGAVIDALSNTDGAYAALLLGKFNLDTLEAIPRSASYLSKQLTATPARIVMQAAHMGARNRREILDSFWRQKDFIYQRLIYAPIGIQFDWNAQDYMRKHVDAFERDHFYLTESELRRRHPNLFSRLNQPRWDTVEIPAKRYVIEASEHADNERYRIVKEMKKISFELRPKQLLVEDYENGRLFKDEYNFRLN